MPTHHEHTQSPHDTTQCLKQAMLWLSTLPWDVTIEVSGRTIVWTWQLTNVDELKVPKEDESTKENPKDAYRPAQLCVCGHAHTMHDFDEDPPLCHDCVSGDQKAGWACRKFRLMEGQ